MASGVEIIGMPQLQARLHAVGTVGLPMMKLLAAATVTESKALVARRTSNLSRTINVQSVTPVSATVVASANYAAFVEFDTRPHEIRPTRAAALAWASQGGFTRLTGSIRTPSARRRLGGTGTASDLTFAMVVHHPGTKAQPFLRPGAQKAIETVGLDKVVVAAWDSKL